MVLERHYQPTVIARLRELLPGCLVLKNDPGYLQGIPDLVFFYEDRWGMLEVKPSIFASYRPNQEYYIDLLNSMSYAQMICPENEEEVYLEIQRTFRATGNARLP